MKGETKEDLLVLEYKDPDEIRHFNNYDAILEERLEDEESQSNFNNFSDQSKSHQS